MNIINCKTYTYTGTTRYKYDLLYIHGRHNEKFEDTKVVISICISKKDRQHNGQKKNRQHNGQKKKDKQKSTKDRVKRTLIKIWGELRCTGRVGSYLSTSGTCCVNLVTNPVICFICWSQGSLHRHLFLSMGRSMINALIVDLPMDRNKCLWFISIMNQFGVRLMTGPMGDSHFSVIILVDTSCHLT